MIRNVKLKDAARILEIYAPYILHTPITFEIELPSLEEFKQRIKTIASQYPYLVYEKENQILGYAYAHRSMERKAYDYNAEISIYVDAAHCHEHIGTELMNELLSQLKSMNIINVYSLITIPNDASERLHEKFGFKQIGILKNSGYKLKTWHDVGWYEKCLNDHVLDPAPIHFKKVYLED